MTTLPSTRILLASLVLASALYGCAHPRSTHPPVVARPAPLPPPPPPAPPPPRLAHLVVLPVDKLALPEMADELNGKLVKVKLAGATDATLSTVSMETAQLQSECAEPTDGCYLRIARLVDADRLLWAQVEKVNPKGKKKKGVKPATRIQVILFDRDKLGVAGQAEGTFPAAIIGSDLDKLIASTVGSQAISPQAVPVTPAPTAAAPASAPPAATRPAGPAFAPAAPAPAPARPAPAASSPQPATYAPAPAPAAPPAPGYPPPAAAPPAYSPAPPAAPAYPPPAASPPPVAYPPPAASPPPAAAPPPVPYQPVPSTPTVTRPQ